MTRMFHIISKFGAVDCMKVTTGYVTMQRFISSSSLVIHQTTVTSRFLQRPKKEYLTFGTTISDHMLVVNWEGTWKTPQIIPYQALSISPASSCLNYGMSCFEGMKAYRSTVDESIRLFRPQLNMERLRNSMKRLDMPGSDFNAEELIECIKKLVHLDRDWIPDGEGYSLYIRPCVIGSNNFLGVAPPTSLLLYVITSPVGPYYKTGFRPIRLKSENKYVRAWRGGTGNAKVAGNYAPTMKPASEAALQGYGQVLWMLGDEITEVGAMNVFFVLRDESDSDKKILVTPPLDRGDILPGVTRRSIIELANTWDNIHVQERNITLTEIKNAAMSNRLLEAFGAGTAAVVTPICAIDDINIHSTGDVTQRMWKEIVDIQYGRTVHPNGWSVKV